MINDNLTLVTALFDIGRSDIDAGFSRSFEHYLECFKKLLAVDLPMVVFCDEAVADFVRNNRDMNITRIVIKTLDDIRAFPFYNQVQNIRNNETWKNRSGWIVGSPQSSLELYNPLVMSKQFYLNDASIFNFFDTKYFAWIDAGLANTVPLDSYLTKTNIIKLLPKMDKMLYLAFPYDGTVEVHGFEKNAMNQYATANTEYVVRGGFFGGTREYISDINDLYYNMLNDTLNSGLMGTEESIFTILSYRNRDKINLHMIEANGLIYKFFEDLSKERIEYPNVKHGSIAIYALTYNLPEQFEMWVKSFASAYPNEFKKYSKYVLNNTTDKEADKKYKKLFKDYGFTEFKYNNIGINDGRFEIAKHFESSDHEFMVFFEDDMLLHQENVGKSKLGFPTYYKRVFELASEITKIENLDFIKLSFDEFFGNNLENWGWYNIPADKKEKYFKDNNKKTVVEYIGSHKGLPYAVGEYHYCNWPILFTKKGNKKVFLETEYEHKYEQTWMSMVCTMQKEKTLRAGSLLASIINHNRVYHYPKENRRENKHYKNGS